MKDWDLHHPPTIHERPTPWLTFWNLLHDFEWFLWAFQALSPGLARPLEKKQRSDVPPGATNATSVTCMTCTVLRGSKAALGLTSFSWKLHGSKFWKDQNDSDECIEPPCSSNGILSRHTFCVSCCTTTHDVFRATPLDWCRCDRWPDSRNRQKSKSSRFKCQIWSGKKCHNEHI